MTEVGERVEGAPPVEGEPSPVSEPVALVTAAAKSFGSVTALLDVSLEISAGSIHLLLGPNGSGKSTLIRLLTGVLRPTKGTVRVLATDPYRHPERLARGVGIAYENHSLPSWSSADRFLRFAAKAKGLPEKAIDDVGEQFGIREYWDRDIGTYSSGMRKRVSLAQAWLGDPPLIIMDEPFSNLDPEGRRLLAKLLGARALDGATTVIATHLAEPDFLPTHLSCLLDGRVVVDGPIRSLAERYDAWTVTLAVPDPVEAIRRLFAQGLRAVAIAGDGLALRGNAAIVASAREILRGEGIDVRVVGESFDIWGIYRAILMGRDHREEQTQATVE